MKIREDQGIIISFAALSVLTVFVCMTKYADFDLWWHLKLGESIVTNWRFPSEDTFSYTALGRHQFTGEWLADTIIFLTFKAAGFWGLNILKALVLLLTFRFLYLQIKDDASCSRGNGTAAVITLLLVLFAIRFRLFVRPYLFSLPMLALYLYHIARWRKGTSEKIIYLLPVLMIFWVNMSVGAIFGIFVLGVAAFLELIERRSWGLFPVFLLTVLASLVNPESYGIYTLALDLTSDPYRALVGEYQPVTMDILFGSGMRYTLCFQIMTAGSILYFILFRGWKNVFHLIIFVFFLYEALRQVRLIEMFSLVAAPFVLIVLAGIFSRFPELPIRFRFLQMPLLSVVIMALIPWTVLNSRVYAFGVGPKETAFPEVAIRFLDEQGIRGRMFNSYGFGGYLIWRGSGRQVFIDGRYRRLYTPSEYGAYKGIMDSAKEWNAAEQKYGFDYAVLEYDLQSRRFPAHLQNNPDWALVYWDNHSLIYVKRTPARAALIATHEYRVAKPAFLDFSYLEQYKKQGKMYEALDQLNREVQLNPENQFVVLARAYLRYEMGAEYNTWSKNDLERIVSLKPDFAIKHSALATLLSAAGDNERARMELLLALKMDPFDAAALSQVKKFGIAITLPKKGIPGHP